MTSSADKTGAFPSPSEKEELAQKIDETRAFLLLPLEVPARNELRIKLADLLVGRNDTEDYIEAAALYDEVINTSPPGDVRAKALIGRSELTVQSHDPGSIEEGIQTIDRALDEIEGSGSEYFKTKAKLVKAELFLRRGKEQDNIEALDLYEEILADKRTPGYFRMRALVGKLDIMEYFEPAKLKDDLNKLTAECENVLGANKERASDYFRIKGLALLSELYIKSGTEDNIAKAKKALNELANNEAAGVDLRARASIDLAEISSEGLARSLLRQVRHMEGIDDYIMKKARLLEDKLKQKNSRIKKG